MLLKTATNANITNTDHITTTPTNATGAYLAANGQPCIGVHLVNRQRRNDGTYVPAHIQLTQHPTNANSGVCQQVRTSQVVSDYFNSTVPNLAGNGTISAVIPVGSSKGIYQAAPAPRQPERTEGAAAGAAGGG